MARIIFCMEFAAKVAEARAFRERYARRPAMLRFTDSRCRCIRDWSTDSFDDRLKLSVRERVVDVVPDDRILPLVCVGATMLRLELSPVAMAGEARGSNVVQVHEEKLARLAGARFVLREPTHEQSVSRGESLQLQMKWANVGVGKLYRPYAFRL